MRTIMHLDMNSYFATAEQQANPYLRGKPVGVVKAKGRGCVIAASVEAKKYGVKTGVTVWEAKRLCPQIILVPSDMDKYFSLTQDFIKIISDYSPTVEVFSIDEMFVDITDSQNLFGGGVLEIALEIKRRINQELGEWMRASIGISFTKLLAKLASEMHKPDGLTFLTSDDYVDKTADLPVSEVCGIGYARTAWLNARGASTLRQARQLVDLPPEIYDLVWLRLEEPLVGMEDLEPAKSVSRTYTTFGEVEDLTGIEMLVRNLIEEACAKLREMDMAGRTVWLSLRSGKEEREFWTRKTLMTPTNDGLVVFNLVWQDYLRRPLAGVRFGGTGVSNLVWDVQTPLFGRRGEMLKATDTVNEKWGLFTVYPARLLGGELVRPEVTGYLGDKYYRFRSQN